MSGTPEAINEFADISQAVSAMESPFLAGLKAQLVDVLKENADAVWGVPDEVE